MAGSKQDVPRLGEIVIVRTVLHDGERAVVTALKPAKAGRRYPTTDRTYVRLHSVNHSLAGAEGWYDVWEIERTEDRA